MFETFHLISITNISSHIIISNNNIIIIIIIISLSIISFFNSFQ